MFVMLGMSKHPHFRHAMAVLLLLAALVLPSAFLTPSAHAQTVQTCTQAGSYGGCGVFVDLNNGNTVSGSNSVSSGELTSFGSFIILGPSAATGFGGAGYEDVQGAASTIYYTSVQS